VVVATLLLLQSVLIAALLWQRSKRRRAIHSLAESEREFSTLVENSPDIITRLDRNLRYIYISPAFEKVTGVPTERFIGKTPGEIALDDYDWQTFETCCREAMLTRKPSQRAFDYHGHNYRTRVVPEFSGNGLVESVLAISEDVTKRLQSERELSELTVRLFNLQDEERRRIARELHDGTAQNLFAISVNLAKLNKLGFTASDEVQQLVAECQSLSDQSVQEIRTLSYLLHPPLLDHAGLVSALQWYVEGFTKRSGIFVDIFAQPIGRLPTEIEMALFRVVQEALTNVRRHSGSETASIRLERRPNEVALEIRDQGHGLAKNDLPADASEIYSIGVGVSGMRQRLLQLGGTLEIVSKNGHGTTISAVVPLTNGVNHGTHPSRRRS
jgi:PAS domain S-box-containing protein